MAFSRALRTDTIANIADFGALPGNDATHAALNARAFRDALAVSTRIAVPATPPLQFYAFEQIMYKGDARLPASVEIFGEGPTRTSLRYYPSGSGYPDVALSFAQGFARSRIHDLRLVGPTSYPNSNLVGISFEQSQFNWVHDVWIEDFAVGVRFNVSTAGGHYSAHNVLERFEIQRITSIGVQLGDSANAETIGPGRCQNILNAAGTDGVAISLFGSSTQPIGAMGPNGIVVRSVACDAAFTSLRIRNARGVLVTGCYFEPGNGTPPRKMLDIDAASEDINLVGNAFSPPSPPTNEAERTPVFSQQVPEARGPALEGPSFPALGYYNQRTQGASNSGATAAHVNRIRNGDMSRGTLYWPTENLGGGTQVPITTSYVISGQSLCLTVGTDPQFRMYQDVVLNSGLRSITVSVRYRLLTAAANAFRIELFDVASGTSLGYYSDTSVGGPSAQWQTRSLTGRFEGLPGGVTGPRTMRVRIYPYNNTQPGPTGQQVLVDSVWLVDGEYAAPYRPFTEGIELLRGDDRQLLFSGSRTAPVPPTALAFAHMPANAVGAVLELRIYATQAASVPTYLSIDDQEGAPAQRPRELHATASSRWVMTDFTLPITPGGAMPTWELVGPTGTNVTSVGIRLKAWILRL